MPGKLRILYPEAIYQWPLRGSRTRIGMLRNARMIAPSPSVACLTTRDGSLGEIAVTNALPGCLQALAHTRAVRGLSPLSGLLFSDLQFEPFGAFARRPAFGVQRFNRRGSPAQR
jgi:hypothetical protein